MKIRDRFNSKVFRDTWVQSQVKMGIANQLRNIRGELSQKEFGEKIGRPQNVVSRLEDPNYGNMSVQTLLDIASKLDIGLIIRFASFGKVVKESTSLTEQDMTPFTFAQEIAASGLAQTLQVTDAQVFQEVKTAPRNNPTPNKATTVLFADARSTNYSLGTQ